MFLARRSEGVSDARERCGSTLVVRDVTVNTRRGSARDAQIYRHTEVPRYVHLKNVYIWTVPAVTYNFTVNNDEYQFTGKRLYKRCDNIIVDLFMLLYMICELLLYLLSFFCSI